MSKQTKITKSAKDEECQVRIEFVCNGNPKTTIFAHLNGGGMGMKHSDAHGAYCCGACHTWLDGGYAKHTPRQIRDLYHLEAIMRTQLILIEKGLIEVKS